jgi:hypothetical protein
MTKPILSDPRHGWATLTLPTENDEPPFIANISYVTDVMFNALSACINYLNDGIAAVKFNAEENGDIIILIDTCNCKVIYENNKILNINLSGNDFCKNILDCYASDRNTWMQFGTMDDNPEVADMQKQTFQKLETIIRTSMAIRTEVYTCMKGDNHED